MLGCLIEEALGTMQTDNDPFFVLRDNSRPGESSTSEAKMGHALSHAACLVSEQVEPRGNGEHETWHIVSSAVASVSASRHDV